MIASLKSMGGAIKTGWNGVVISGSCDEIGLLGVGRAAISLGGYLGQMII